MQRPVDEIISDYDPASPLAEASTIPAPWYTDSRIFEFERQTVFAASWQLAGRVEQTRNSGDYVSCQLPGGEPIVVVRGGDGVLRGFYNVCRHHAAAVVTEPEGSSHVLRCPYHGWTYSLEGELRGTPDFAGVCHFDRREHGLLPVDVDVWEKWVFVRVRPTGPSLGEFVGQDLLAQVEKLRLGDLHWIERRRYRLNCNWKVYVDNYLDGGYHVPHLHKALDSVLDYAAYTIETGDRYCLQRSPTVTEGADPETGAVRAGAAAMYYWIYPNFMINCYEGAMDTNLVIPCGVDQTEVIFDFYFSDRSDAALPRHRASIEVSERIQREDEAICESVQRGLRSGAYTAGRLSVRREAGEHLFHRLLYADLQKKGQTLFLEKRV